MGTHLKGCSVLALALVPTAVFAQATNSVTPVTPATAPIGAPLERQAEKANDDSLDPVGAHFGSFTLYPKLEAALIYDDNVYALETKTDDVVGRVSPSVRIVGDMMPFKTNLNASLDRLEYKDRDSENRTDWRVTGTTSFEFAPKSTLSTGAGYIKSHEDRGDPNSAFTNVRPTLFYTKYVSAEAKRELAKLRAGLRGSFYRYNYRDAPQLGGGITNNDDRDRKDYLVEGRLGYQFSPGYTIITRLAYDEIVYSSILDDAGYNRRSKGVRASGGVEFELTRLLTGEATAGYIWRNYRDPRFPNLKRFGFNVSLDWSVTPLTSVRFILDRGAQETVAPGYRAFLADTYSIRVEHELLRNLKLTGTARYIHNDYLKSTISPLADRVEKFYGGSIGARYDFNRNFYALLGYDYNKKTSTATTPGSEFDRNKVSLTVGTQF